MTGGLGRTMVYGMVAAFCVTVIIEWLVISCFIWGDARVWLELFPWVLLVTIITNPAAQFAILFLADPDLLGSGALSLLVLCLIELVVVIVEFGLLIWIFGRMYRRGVLDTRLTARRTFVMALLANPASLVGTFGLIFLFAVMTT